MTTPSPHGDAPGAPAPTGTPPPTAPAATDVTLRDLPALAREPREPSDATLRNLPALPSEEPPGPATASEPDLPTQAQGDGPPHPGAARPEGGPGARATLPLPVVALPAGADEPAVPALAEVPAERPGPCTPGWAAALTVPAAALAAAWLVWHAGLLPGGGHPLGALPRPPRAGTGPGLWSGLAVLGALALFVLCGLTRGRPGSVWVLTRFGAYRGTVRRTGLLWISPLLRRRRVDVGLRHWRSRPVDAVDADGTPVQATVLVVWRVRESARAVFAVDDHRRFLREAVEAALARAVARYPADDFRGECPTLRDCDRLAGELLRLVAAQVGAVGLEVFSATPVRIDYAPEVAPAMRRARIAALDARRRRALLDDVLATVAETVRGVCERGPGEWDAYERKGLARDLTVALLARSHDDPPPEPSRP